MSPHVQGRPTLAPVLHHDWARHYYRYLPERPDLQEFLQSPFTFSGTGLEFLRRSREGVEGAVLVARNPRASPGRRNKLIWHGRTRIPEEAFQGWFGHRLQRLQTDAFRLLTDRIDHFLIADASTRPRYVLPLPTFARLGISHGVLEGVLDAPVVVCTESLFSAAAHCPSLRVYVPFAGDRYGEGTRKLFFDPNGNPVTVEWIAREVLKRLGYEVVAPGVFARLFFALVGRPASNFTADAWPRAFLHGRLSPLEWVARGDDRLREARAVGLAQALESALENVGRRPPFSRHPVPEGALPLIARWLSRRRFHDFAAALGDETLAAVFEGFLCGYRVHAADWFAWQEDGRSHFCEVKSQGDHLRESQKEAMQWCQRSGLVDYRLLELLHNAPAANAQPLSSAAPSAHEVPHAAHP